VELSKRPNGLRSEAEDRIDGRLDGGVAPLICRDGQADEFFQHWRNRVADHLIDLGGFAAPDPRRRERLDQRPFGYGERAHVLRVGAVVRMPVIIGRGLAMGAADRRCRFVCGVNRPPAVTSPVHIKVIERVTFRANMTPHVQRILQQYQSDDPIPRWGHGWARFHGCGGRWRARCAPFLRAERAGVRSGKRGGGLWWSRGD
jgi:hypothetical protein